MTQHSSGLRWESFAVLASVTYTLEAGVVQWWRVGPGKQGFKRKRKAGTSQAMPALYDCWDFDKTTNRS